VEAGSQVNVRMTVEAPQPGMLPENIPLNLVYEDRGRMGGRQAGGLVVHPGAGNRSHTLQNALLGMDPSLESIREPASSIASIKTPAACWWWRERRRRIRP